jgi:hypothetical protein
MLTERGQGNEKTEAADIQFDAHLKGQTQQHL